MTMIERIKELAAYLALWLAEIILGDYTRE